MATALLALEMSAMEGFSDRMREGLKQMARLLADILLLFSWGSTYLALRRTSPRCTRATSAGPTRISPPSSRRNSSLRNRSAATQLP